MSVKLTRAFSWLVHTAAAIVVDCSMFVTFATVGAVLALICVNTLLIFCLEVHVFNYFLSFSIKAALNFCPCAELLIIESTTFFCVSHLLRK